MAFAVLYAYGPTPAGSTVNNLPAWIPPHSASAFTVTGIARSAKTYSIDILVGHTTGQAFTDLPGGGTMPGDPGGTGGNPFCSVNCVVADWVFVAVVENGGWNAMFCTML